MPRILTGDTNSNSDYDVEAQYSLIYGAQDMYFFDLKGLIEHLRSEKNTEQEGVNYFIANWILTAAVSFASSLAPQAAKESPSGSSIALGLLLGSVFLLVGVSLFKNLYTKNGANNGKNFFNRLFALYWVVGLRIFVVIVPLCLVFFTMSSLVPSLIPVFMALALLALLASLVIGYITLSNSFEKVARLNHSTQTTQIEVTP